MAWRNQYWDMISNLFWNPTYIGLKSIAWDKLEKDGETVRVPLSLLNHSGPIYTRKRKHKDLEMDLAKKEEILNHFFNLTFSIAPDALLEKLFCAAVRVSDAGPFDFIGQAEMIDELKLQNKNVGQHDGLIVSNLTAIAMEIKTGSSSSRSQLVKYVALLARLLKERPHIRNHGLLFICPAGHQEKLLDSCGLPGLTIQPEFIDRNLQFVNPDVQAVLTACKDETRTVLADLKIAVMTWTEMHSTLCDIRTRLKSRDAYQQTLHRLLDGFIQQLEAQEKTGIPREQIEAAQPLFSGPKEVSLWARKLEAGSALTPEERRKALIAYVSTTSWGGPSVIIQCQASKMDELESFVAALKDGQSSISMKFRWAADDDMSGPWSASVV